MSQALFALHTHLPVWCGRSRSVAATHIYFYLTMFAHKNVSLLNNMFAFALHIFSFHTFKCTDYNWIIYSATSSISIWLLFFFLFLINIQRNKIFEKNSESKSFNFVKNAHFFATKYPHCLITSIWQSYLFIAIKLQLYQALLLDFMIYLFCNESRPNLLHLVCTVKLSVVVILNQEAKSLNYFECFLPLLLLFLLLLLRLCVCVSSFFAILWEKYWNSLYYIRILW